MVLLDNIISLDLKTGTLNYNKKKEKVFLSHAHYDHIPSLKNKTVYSSKETFKIASLRKKITHNNFFENHKEVKFLDAGHTIGSKMFFFKNHKILFTGDFRTKKSYCGKAQPKKAETLIIESTFANEKFIFPDYNETLKEIKDYILEQNNKNLKVNFQAYTFGKSQEIQFLLEKYNIPFSVSKEVNKINEKLNLKFKNKTSIKESQVYIGRERIFEKTISASGWAIQPSYKYKLKLDEAFILSDHADYISIIEFIKKVDPERIFTFHGFSNEFALKLKKAGYNAYSLDNKNRNILDYAM